MVGGTEHQHVAFGLWDGYECRTAHEAHNFALLLLEGPEPVEVLDADGEVWPLWRNTLREVWTRRS